MNGWHWSSKRPTWRHTTILGLLIATAFLVHDLGMAGFAPGSGTRFVPVAAAPLSLQVVHGAEGGEAAHEVGAPHSHDADDPLQSHCAVTRVAAPTVNDSLGSALQAIPSAIGPLVGWATSGGCAAWPADAPFRSSSGQRTLFQVFLI